jgi:large subunit ribosomal protein L18
MAHTKIRSPKARTRQRRKYTLRKRISGTPERPRLSVFRSNAHIYAQAIDDVNQVTLAAASDLDASLKGGTEGKDKSQIAKMVGEIVAKKLQEKQVKAVVFDRNGFIYHGRVKAVAEGAREGGLEF